MTTAAAAAAATKTNDAVPKEIKINRYKKAAIKTLSKIRSFYRRTVSECAGQMSTGLYGGEGGYPPHLHYSCPDSLPRSYSTVSSTASGNDDDFRHLLRAASANSITAKKIEQENFRGKVIGGVGRSQSVGVPVIGRIDEEEPSEFEDDVNMKLDFNPKNRINGQVLRRRVHS